MVNAGAIATADLIEGDGPSANASAACWRCSAAIAAATSTIDNAVFMSERATGHRNRAIGHLMLNFGMVDADVDEALELYFQQCSVLVNCRDLAMMGATLANGGVNPRHRRAGDRRRVRQIPAERHALLRHVRLRRRVGLSRRHSGQERRRRRHRGGRARPARHRRLLAAPRREGNSVRGIAVCRHLAREFGLHVFATQRQRARFQAVLAGDRASATTGPATSG